MTINITTLEDHCKRNSFFISTSIDFDKKPLCFTFTELDRQYEPATVDLSIKEIEEILLLNNITGRGGKLEAARAMTPAEYGKGPLGSRVKQREIENLVYDTIAKYIGLLLGTMPVDLYERPDIKLLSHHRNTVRKGP